MVNMLGWKSEDTLKASTFPNDKFEFDVTRKCVKNTFLQV